MFIPDPDPNFLPIPDPGSRGQKGTRSRIRNTALYQDTSGPVCAGGSSPRGRGPSGTGGRPGRKSEEVPELAEGVQPAPPPSAQEGQVGAGAQRREGQSSR